MEELTVQDLKKWLKIDYDEEDSDLQSLLFASKEKIRIGTGITWDLIKNRGNEAIEFYKLIQKMICNRLYNGEDTEDKIMVSNLMQLEVYKYGG